MSDISQWASVWLFGGVIMGDNYRLKDANIPLKKEPPMSPRAAKAA